MINPTIAYQCSELVRQSSLLAAIVSEIRRFVERALEATGLRVDIIGVVEFRALGLHAEIVGWDEIELLGFLVEDANVDSIRSAQEAKRKTYFSEQSCLPEYCVREEVLRTLVVISFD